MRTSEQQLILAGANLVRTEVGQEFLAALKAASADAMHALCYAPPDHLAYAQGVARQWDVLVKTLTNAPENAKKILDAEEAKKLRGNT